MSGAAKTDAKGDVSRAPGWKELFSLAALVGAAICVWPVSAVHVTAGSNALSGSLPVNNSHSKMLWPLWVVLIVRSTGSALTLLLFALPNLRIMPQLGPMGARLMEAVFNLEKSEAKVASFHLARSARKLLAHR